MQLKHIPAIFARSVEFSQMKVRSKQELEVLMRIKKLDEVKECLPNGVEAKPVCLLLGFMNDLFTKEELEIQTIKDDLETILRTIPSFIDIMTETITEMALAFRAKKSPKRIIAKNLLSMLMFSKNVMQTMNSKEPFM